MQPTAPRRPLAHRSHKQNMAIIFKNPLIKIVLLKDAKKGNIRTSKTFLEQNLFYSYLTRRQRIHKLHEKKKRIHKLQNHFHSLNFC